MPKMPYKRNYIPGPNTRASLHTELTEERAEVQAVVDTFIHKGGKIQQIPSGLSSIKQDKLGISQNKAMRPDAIKD